MSLTIQVPEGISWVAASLMSIPVLLQWQAWFVGSSRKAAKVQYPRLYAEKSEQAENPEALKFNCKQRAHQNTLENLPAILLTTCIASIEHPKIAGAALATWVFGRVLYTVGYASGDPEKRHRGVIAYLGVIALLGASSKVVYNLFTAGV